MLHSVTSWVQGSPSALDISADSLIVTTKRDESFSGAVGYAWVGGVCNKARYANVNAVTKDVVLYGSIIIAHEFGHTFGFMHDGSSSAGTGSCDADPNIMGPTLNGDESVFSQCSIDQYNAGSYRSGGTLYSVDLLPDGTTDFLSVAVFAKRAKIATVTVMIAPASTQAATRAPVNFPSW